VADPNALAPYFTFDIAYKIVSGAQVYKQVADAVVKLAGGVLTITAPPALALTAMCIFRSAAFASFTRVT
jgi:hypothetical protein